MNYGRFDGRLIRVDKASDAGPKNGHGRGAGPSYSGQRGYPQQQFMFPGYGMPNTNAMYSQTQYGRGYAQQPVPYNTPPAPGKNRTSLDIKILSEDLIVANENDLGYGGPTPYPYPDQQGGQQPQGPPQY